MSEVRQATAHPTAVLAARSLETGRTVLILTTPINVRENPTVLNLADEWIYREWSGELIADPGGHKRRRATT